MATASNIYLFSRAIRTGKTTELTGWCKGKNAAGILTPNVEGRRVLLDIATGNQHMLELQIRLECSISIGRFHFDNEVFRIGRDILLQAKCNSPEWLVVDEVGPLEIKRREGLEPALGAIVEHYKRSGSNLLLVVRDSLLEEVVRHYNLENSVVIHHLNDIP